MAANIDTMIYVGETPWHGLGVHYEEVPTCAEEIIKKGKFDWEVAAANMTTEEIGLIPNYYALYRKDNSNLLGVVNKSNISIVQNRDTFNSIDHLIGKDITFDTAASLGKGETVFGCFQLVEKYKLLDDEIEHYFVIMNDHLKPDGKVTILNTPIRVVCQNTLNAALSKNSCIIHVPVVSDAGINRSIADKVIMSSRTSIMDLKDFSEKMVEKKVDDVQLAKILDELFPFIKDGDDNSHRTANERTAMIRNTFIDKCMKVDNLANYAGTHYQVFQALADFTQHYHMKADKICDLKYRMNTTTGIGVDGPVSLMNKYMKIANAAA